MTRKTPVLILGNSFSSLFFQKGLQKQILQSAIKFSPSPLFDLNAINLLSKSPINRAHLNALMGSNTGGMATWGGGLSLPSERNIFSTTRNSEFDNLRSNLDIDLIKKFTGVKKKSFNIEKRLLNDRLPLYMKSNFILEKHIYIRNSFSKRFYLNMLAGVPDILGSIESIKKFGTGYEMIYTNTLSQRKERIVCQKLIIGMGAIGNSVINSIINSDQKIYPFGNHLSVELGHFESSDMSTISRQLIQDFSPQSKDFYTFRLRSEESAPQISFRLTYDSLSRITVRCLIDTGIAGNFIRFSGEISKKISVDINCLPQTESYTDIKIIQAEVEKFARLFNLKFKSTIVKLTRDFADSAHYYGTIPIDDSDEKMQSVGIHGESLRDSNLYFLGTSGMKYGSHIHPTLFAMIHSYMIGQQIDL